MSFRTLIAILFCLISTNLSAETNFIEPFIDGYSPVSYFTVNKAEKGSPEFSVTHKGKLYYLTSAEQIEIFNKNPDKYRPRHEVCSYSLALGMQSSLDPRNFKVVANTLLLFHKSEQEDGLDLWNKSKLTDEELIRRADKQYTIFTF